MELIAKGVLMSDWERCASVPSILSTRCLLSQLTLKKVERDFLGGAVIKTPHFQCKGQSLGRELDLPCLVAQPK